MDVLMKNQTRGKTTKPIRNLRPNEYELHTTNEKIKGQLDLTKTKVERRTRSPAREDINLQFGVPQNDDNLERRPRQNNTTNKNYISPGYIYTANTSNQRGRSPVKNDRTDQERNMREWVVEKEQVTRDPPCLHNIRERSFGANPSYICQAINHDGEPVLVNNQLVTDELILSCRPRQYYEQICKGQPTVDSAQRDARYIYYPPVVEIYEHDKTETRNIQLCDNLEIQQHQRDTTTTLGAGITERYPLDENRYRAGLKSEKYYTAKQCENYRKRFKRFLWALFVISTLLVIVGIFLLFIALHYFLFHEYINVVIDFTSFYLWMRILAVIAVLIVTFGLYGIMTSTARTRTMLISFCILAVCLIVVILIFLILLWVMFNELKRTQHESMEATFMMYRCDRRTRVAWDTLHEQFKCCGINDRGNWKYIPPSCCKADNFSEKLACINHFIKEEQAFEPGCRIFLEEYFSTKFLVVTYLLILAVILLLLGVLVAYQLLNMFNTMLLCREIHANKQNFK